MGPSDKNTRLSDNVVEINIAGYFDRPEELPGAEATFPAYLFLETERRLLRYRLPLSLPLGLECQKKISRV